MAERDSLSDLLNVATDSIQSPGLEQTALRLARRRMTRRRVAATATVAVCVAAAVVGGVYAGQHGSETLPPAAPANQTPTASESPTAAAPQTKVWPQWDPGGELPSAADDIAPALPGRIDPPNSSPPIAEDPVDFAVAVAVVVDDKDGGTVQVLGTDGGWRTVPLEDDDPSATISPEGTRVSVTYYAGNTGAVIYDLGTGASRTLPLPDDYQPYEFTQWTFIDENRLLLTDADRAWVVDARTGSAQPLPEGISGGLSSAVDPTGGILVSADHAKTNVLTDYSGGKTRSVSLARIGRLSEMRADADTVVGTSYYGRRFSVVVADRATLTPQVILPVRDDEANYSNFGLGTFALTADGVVLLRVETIGAGREGFRVVAWDPATGELSLVSRADKRLVVDFAENQLR